MQVDTMSRPTNASRRLRVPQLAEAINQDDDWTGLTDATARRKRQNRLNVRAYRKRKAALCPESTKEDSKVSNAVILPVWTEQQQAITWKQPDHAPGKQQPLLPMDTPAAISINAATFPLSSDHLIVLVQFNVLRGSLEIREHLDAALCEDVRLRSTSWPTDLHCFTLHSDSALARLPPHLHPTRLQQTVPHPHWIDNFAHPRIRDNLIQALGQFDDDDLWLDIVGGLFTGFTEDREQNGLMVWKTPWSWEGWEVSEEYFRKWGWTLKGCGDVLDTTNKWRRMRGEEPIVIELN